MIRAIRAGLALTLLTILAACGGSGDSAPGASHPPRFLSYDGPPVTQIVVNKSDRMMYLVSGKTVLKSYKVGLGGQPIGDKKYEGDGKTPEGIYFIDRFNPRSAYHLSVGVSYPNTLDTAEALAAGMRPGGDIFIHGQPNRIIEGYRVKGDWTDGCIALDNHQIAELFAATPIGTEVEIRP